MQHTTFTFQSLTRLFTVLFFITLASGVFAQASLSVQGVLTKSDGTAVDDNIYTVTFKLFDAPTGGNEVHSEPIDIETIGGVYSTVLGQNPSYPLNAPFNTIYYLSVRVGSSELLPRPKLTHAPYALSLLGQTNQFPSTGRVNADFIVVPGGTPSVGIANKGYSFGTGGDPDGGLFSKGDDTVAIYTNGGERLRTTSAGAHVFGNQSVSGISSATKVLARGGLPNSNAGVASVGFSFDGFGDQDAGMFSNGDDNLRFYANNVEGISLTDDIINLNHRTILKSGAGGGVVFDNGTSTGFVGLEPNGCSIYANGFELTKYGANGTTYFPFDVVLQKLNSSTGTPSQVMRRRNSDGLIMVDNSSRRYKTNIRPLVDDFRLILKAQPVVYTGKGPESEGFDEIGYIAEEMDSIGLGRLVIRNGDQIESFSYDRTVLYAVEILKMQDQAIARLQEELAALKQENVQLKSENSTLQTDNGNLQSQQAIFSKQLDDISKRMNMLETLKVENNRK